MVNSLELVKLILRSRVTVRSFSPSPPSLGLLKEIGQASLFAPSSFSIHPWHVVLVVDYPLRQAIYITAVNRKNTQILTSAAIFVIFCRENSYLQWDNLDFMEHFLIHNSLSSFRRKSVRDLFSRKNSRNLTLWSERQVFMVVQNLLLLLSSAGLISAPLEGFSPLFLKEILKNFLPKELINEFRPVLIVAAGSPDSREVAEAVRFKKKQYHQDVFFHKSFSVI